MISEIIIPDLGATGGDVTLEEWLVKPGQVVKTGQALYVVATDKAAVEVEAYRDGVIQTILVPQGETVPLGTVIALLADSMDEETELPVREPVEIPTPPFADATRVPAPEPGKRILASPLARRIAAEADIDLGSLTGSGAKGQVLKRDVVALINTRKATGSSTGMQRELLSPMRKIIADRTTQSKSQIPHFYTTITIDMQAAMEMRRQAVDLAEREGRPRPTITDLCIRAAALALRDIPSLNARFEHDSLFTYTDINIGLVVGLHEGMLIPVIERADQLDFYSLASATQKVRQHAQAGQLRDSEMGRGTFTISNLGMYEIDSFTAVINPPEVAILALGQIKEQPSVVNGAIIPRPLMVATLSVDHRVVDGITAARFLAKIKNYLENPFRLALDAPQEPNP